MMKIASSALVLLSLFACAAPDADSAEDVRVDVDTSTSEPARYTKCTSVTQTNEACRCSTDKAGTMSGTLFASEFECPNGCCTAYECKKYSSRTGTWSYC